MAVSLQNPRNSPQGKRWYAACPNKNCSHIVFRTDSYCEECFEVYEHFDVQTWTYGDTYGEITPYNTEDPDAIWDAYWDSICFRCEANEKACTCPEGPITVDSTRLLWNELEYTNEFGDGYKCSDCAKQYQTACPGVRMWLLNKVDNDVDLGEIDVCHKFLSWSFTNPNSTPVGIS